MMPTKKNNFIIPFQFYTSLPLVELTGKKAKNLGELLGIIKTIDDSSIFYHTHHYIRRHLFLSHEYPSDFAYWTAEFLQEKELGEKLALLDIRDFGTIHVLREELIKIIADYLAANPAVKNVSAGLEFHFCKTISIIMPAGYQATNLSELKEVLKKVDNHTLYYHLIEAKLYPELKTNDLAGWLIDFKKDGLAQAINNINPCLLPLEETREKIISLIERDQYFDRVKKRMERYETRTIIGQYLKNNQFFVAAKSNLRTIFWKK